MSTHSVRYDGVEYPATPEIITGIYRGLVEHVQSPERPLFAQRLDEIKGGESVILMFGLGVPLTFKTTTALALELVNIEETD